MSGRGGKYYAVAKGHTTGVFTNWGECKAQVDGYSGNSYKSFSTQQEAEAFVRSGSASSSSRAGNGSAAYSSPSSYSSPSYSSSSSRNYGGGGSYSSSSSGSYGGGGGGSYLPSSYDDDVVFSTASSSNSRSGIRSSNGDGRSSASASRSSQRAVVYTDGACESNGASNARAGYGVYFGNGDPRNKSERLIGPQTNQRAELTGAITALEETADLPEVEIRTDSKYVIDMATSWLPSWKEKGLYGPEGPKICKNYDLAIRLDELLTDRDPSTVKFATAASKEMRPLIASQFKELANKPLIRYVCLIGYVGDSTE